MKALINLFIAFHLVALTLWGLPESQFRTAAIKPFRAYLNWSGLWNGWNMFAPNPLALNSQIDATVTFQDGTTANWEFPRMERLSPGERFRKERFRKWRERIRLDMYSVAHVSTARYVAKQLYSDPRNPPVQVTLTRRWADIPAPAACDHQPMPKQYEMEHSYAFLEHEIRPEDLR